jgi:RNA polymerase sigma-70 factor, ECF subfamily
VSATLKTNDDRHEPTAGTLGQLLDAGEAKARVSEQDWVALVRSVAEGDQRALRALYRRSHRIVLTLIMRITGNRQTAEELTLDVFHDVWRRASKYDASGGGSVLGWILNQARSRAIDRLRFEQRKKRASTLVDDREPPADASGLDEALDRLEEATLLHRALTVLTADERQAIETAYFSELTYVETAGHLQQPLGTVKTRIRSALEKLRQALAQARNP